MLDKIFGSAKGPFNTITVFELVMSICFVVVGLIFFSNLDASNSAISIITSILLIFNGILQLFSFFKRSGIDLFSFNIVYAIILIIIGLVAAFLKSTLKIAIGLYFIALGIQKINYGMFLKKYNESSWVFTVVVGALLMVLAIIIFFTGTELENVIKVSSISLIGYGLMNIVNIMLLRHRSKYFIA